MHTSKENKHLMVGGLAFEQLDVSILFALRLETQCPTAEMIAFLHLQK